MTECQSIAREVTIVTEEFNISNCDQNGIARIVVKSLVQVKATFIAKSNRRRVRNLTRHTG